MIPVAHGGSATAYKADVEGAHASPLSNEHFAVTVVPGQDQFVWMQNARAHRPVLRRRDRRRVAAGLRADQRVAARRTRSAAPRSSPALAETCEPNEDLTEWTFTLREGVTFHDGSTSTPTTSSRTYRAQWDADDPLHVGRVGDFTYFSALFGGFLNPPPAAG